MKKINLIISFIILVACSTISAKAADVENVETAVTRYRKQTGRCGFLWLSSRDIVDVLQRNQAAFTNVVLSANSITSDRMEYASDSLRTNASTLTEALCRLAGADKGSLIEHLSSMLQIPDGVHRNLRANKNLEIIRRISGNTETGIVLKASVKYVLNQESCKIPGRVYGERDGHKTILTEVEMSFKLLEFTLA